MARQDFFVGTHYLGWREIPDNRVVPGLEVRRHHSTVLFCPRCGEIWGRLLHAGSRYHQLVHRLCLQHGEGWLSCHPSWSDDPSLFSPDWPPRAIRWEFEALLRHVEREIEQSSQLSQETQT